MALTDTFAKSVKPSAKPAEHPDGSVMYLLVNLARKDWRMDYRDSRKRRTLALGAYPAVLLVKARKACDIAREVLAAGVGPGEAKQGRKHAQAEATANSEADPMRRPVLRYRDWRPRPAP